MAVYKNLSRKSPLSGVEFTPVSQGNFAFFYVDSPLKTDGVKAWLASVGEQVVGTAQSGGHPVLVTRGAKSEKEMLELLSGLGDTMVLQKDKIPFSEKAWKVGGGIAFVGQGMQLASSFLRPDRKADWALRLFAIPNIIATTVTWLYGAQRSPDNNRLHALKEQFNHSLGEHVPDGTLPATNENRASLHYDHTARKTFSEKTDNYLKRHSVNVFETLMRYFGVFALSFPYDKWKDGWQKVKNGEFRNAYKTSRNPNRWTHFSGLACIVGKTIGLSAKAPDPYDPKPPGATDQIREQLSFRLDGWIETLAFGTLAADAFAHKKISFKKGGKEYPDFISGIGGALFSIRYALRHWAPFGVKELDTEELFAHVTDGLAQVPLADLPNVMAETAASLTEQLKDKRMHYGEIYTRLMTDLYHYHHIALPTLNLDIVPAPPENPAPAKSITPRALLDRIPAPLGTHAELAAASKDTPLGLSA